MPTAGAKEHGQVCFATEKNHRKNHPSMLDTDNLYNIL
jgi:hypothetical protein